jgi:ribonuclease BN (tRNA processing enzyme)
LRVYGPRGLEKLLRAFDGAGSYKLFEQPFPLEVREVSPREEFEVFGGLRAEAFSTPHTGESLAVRLRDSDGATLVYTSDTGPTDALAEFARGAAALVLDAHFTPQELPQHRGWGHSDWRQCAQFAAANDVAGLWLFHHKPGRSDEELVRIRTDARRIFPATETASEGEALQL